MRKGFRAACVLGLSFLISPAVARADVLLPEASLAIEVVAVMRPGHDGAALLEQLPGYSGRLLSSGRAVVIRTSGEAEAAILRGLLAADPSVAAAQIDGVVNYVRTGFVPNDPYFPPNVPTLGDPGQWYLKNTITPGLDARVEAAWNQSVTGAGVRVGIVDDGFDVSHVDLAGNYAAVSSFDFGQNDADPSPVLSTDNHGTAMAGIIAATGGNGAGVTGAAPGATWSGLRVNFAAPTAAQFVDATLYESSGASTSIDVKLHAYSPTTRYLNAAAEEAALATSTAAGTIHVYPAGNDRGQLAQDANVKDLQNSPDAITVAAMGSNGKFASYSSFGANVFVTAPSDSATAGTLPVLTTDRSGVAGFNPASDTFADQSYTTKVGGTSSAAAVVAGALALAKQVQPNLDTRMAKHLLAITSTVVDSTDITASSDAGWETNTAGFTFNPNYGFGLVDASALVQAAQDYSGVTPLQTESVSVTFNATIPDTNTYTRFLFGLTSTTPLEEVLVAINITHARRGQIEIELGSPDGTRRRLLSPAITDTSANIQWTFLSNEFWGENPEGLWSLYVRDTVVGTTGQLVSAQITARTGELFVAVPEPTSAGLLITGAVLMLSRRPRRNIVVAS